VLRICDITDRVMLILRAAVQQLVARSEIQLSMLCPNLSTDDFPLPSTAGRSCIRGEVSSFWHLPRTFTPISVHCLARNSLF
jgi:hypothetical protein